MTDLTRLQFAEFSWAIEHDHRGIKQCTGVERCPCRSARLQRNRIGLALRAFPRFEAHCFAKGVSWVEPKTSGPTSPGPTLASQNTALRNT